MMKVVMEKAALSKALGHVQRIVEKRNTIPILSNVLIVADGQTVSLRATDLDIDAMENAPGEVSRAGSTTVPAHIFYDIVRKFPEGAQISLEQPSDGEPLVVKSGRSRFSLGALPPADFPDISSGPFESSFSMPTLSLARLLDAVEFAMSTDETRYYLNGIYLHAAKGDGDRPVLRAVATDGHRLAKYDVDLPKGAEALPGMILPRKVVLELKKLSDGGDETTIAASNVKCRFSIGNVTVTTKLIDGTFPDYQRVIPAHNDKLLSVDLESLRLAVDRVSTMSSERGRSIKLDIRPDRIVVSTVSPDAGSAEDEVEAAFPHAAMSMGFNSRYLLDVLGKVDGETAEIKLGESTAPALIRGKGQVDGVFVLMPTRI